MTSCFLSTTYKQGSARCRCKNKKKQRVQLPHRPDFTLTLRTPLIISAPTHSFSAEVKPSHLMSAMARHAVESP